MKREARCPWIAQLGTELHGWDIILPAILTPVRNGTRCFERPHPVAKTFSGGFKLHLAEAIGIVRHERRQHIVAWVVENPVIDRKYQVVDWSIDPPRSVLLLPAT